MSPEIFSGGEVTMYGFEVDMWAFGVLFFFMLNMEFPFSIPLFIKSSILIGNLNEKKCS